MKHYPCRFGIRSKRPSALEGFSLIELLVVIAIIALLASLMMPSVQKARKKAQLSICSGHLREMGAAFMLFAADNAGFLPNGGCRRCEPRTHWSTDIGPYLGGIPAWDNPLGVMRCPAHKPPRDPKAPATMSYAALAINGQKLNDPNNYYGGGRFRMFLANFGVADLQPERRPLSAVPAASRTAMLTELATDRNVQGSGAELNNIDPFQMDPTSVGTQLGWGDANNVTLVLHAGRVNYLFADGHVQDYDILDPAIWGDGSAGNPRGIWSVYPDD